MGREKPRGSPLGVGPHVEHYTHRFPTGHRENGLLMIIIQTLFVNHFSYNGSSLTGVNLWQ
jgi:hypothetical protein